MGTHAGTRTRRMAAGSGTTPSGTLDPWGTTDSNDGSTRLWLQEPGQPTTWHIVTERIAYRWYRMACGWELRIPDAERIWPAKPGDPQPAPKTRCRSCVQMYPINLLLGGPVFRSGGHS